MRRLRVMIVGLTLIGWTPVAHARDKNLQDLPRDAWHLALAWTAPIKEVARETQRFDPISGTWFGLLEGSLKPVEQTVAFILPQPRRLATMSGG